MQISSTNIYPKINESKRKYLSSNPYQAELSQQPKEKTALKSTKINAKKNINSIMPALETKLIAQDAKKLLSQVKTKSKLYSDKVYEINELNHYIQNKSDRTVKKLAQIALKDAQDVLYKTPSILDEVNELINQGYIFQYQNFSTPNKSVSFSFVDDKVASMDEFDSNNHLIRTTTLKEVELRNGRKIYVPQIIDEYTKNSLNRYTFENDGDTSSLISYQEGVEVYIGMEKCAKQMTFDNSELSDYALDLKAFSDGSESTNTYLYFKDNELKGYKEDFERLKDGSYKYREAMFFENSKLNEYHKGFRKKDDKSAIQIKAIFDDKNISEFHQGVAEFGDMGEKIASIYLFKYGTLSKVLEEYSKNKTGTQRYQSSLKFISSKPSGYTVDYVRKSNGLKNIYHKVEFENGEIYKYEQNCTSSPDGQEAADNVLIYETDGKIIQHALECYKSPTGQNFASKVYNFDAFGKVY